MTGNAKLRPHRIFGRRRRQEHLPQVSLALLVAISLLSVWFFDPPASKSLLDTSNPLVILSTGRTANPLLTSSFSYNPRGDLTPTVRSASSSYGDLCDNGFRSELALLFILIPGVIFLFVGLAILTDDYFVASLERICERLNLSEDVAGATFMAAGSSTPEFFASLLGVFVTKDTVGIGTIVGSAVFNILVIIGLSAALAGAVLKLDWRPLARDSFFYVVSIVMLLVFVVWSTPGVINWWEGLILVATYVMYVLFMAFGNKQYMKWAANLNIGKNKELDDDIEIGQVEEDNSNEQPNVVSDDGRDLGLGIESVIASSAAEKPPNYRSLNPRSQFRALQFAVIAANRLASSSSESSGAEDNLNHSDDDDSERRTIWGVERPTSPLGWAFFPISFFWKLFFSIFIIDCSSDARAHLWWLTFLSSIVFISGISYLMVEAARLAGCLIGIPATAMGLTVLAAGTSVPDALASISVARDGAGDMAVSNAIGSNVFDILLGLGFPWFIGGFVRDTIEIPIEPLAQVVIPIVILFGILILLLAVLMLLKWQLRPLLGYILFGMYGVFVVYTLLDVYVFKFSVE